MTAFDIIVPLVGVGFGVATAIWANMTRKRIFARWAEENAEAIEQRGAWIDEHGLPLADAQIMKAPSPNRRSGA